VHIKYLHIKLHCTVSLCLHLQAFESELKHRSGAAVKTHSQSRYLKKFEDALVNSDEPFENLFSLSTFSLTCSLFARIVRYCTALSTAAY